MNHPFEIVKKILVIDNDPDWHKIIESALKNKGITVDFCEVNTDDDLSLSQIFLNGDSKIVLKDKNKISPSNYDLIFLDLYFTGHHGDVSDDMLGGFKVLRIFDDWQREFIYVPPVIILSGSYNLDRVIRLKEQFNTFDYLYKPELKKIIVENDRDFWGKKKNWDEKFVNYFGLTEFMKRDEHLRTQALAVRRLIELYPEKFWFGYKFWEIVEHTKEHALGVWRILYDWLSLSPFLTGENKLSDTEIFILLISALLHDIGATGNENFNDSLEVRFYHGLITHDILSKEYLNYGFKDKQQHFSKAVGLIAKYHDGQVPIFKAQKLEYFYKAKDDISKYGKLYKDIYGNKDFETAWEEELKNLVCRHDLLISLLMLADAFHICSTRTGPESLAKYKVIFLSGRECEYYKKKLEEGKGDIQLLKKHIKFLNNQQDHYDKHSVIRKITFTEKPLSDSNSISFCFGPEGYSLFTINYETFEKIEGEKLCKICRLIYNDIDYEWKRIGKRLAGYWDHSGQPTWSIMAFCQKCNAKFNCVNRFK